jgi:hypothetical protein
MAKEQLTPEEEDLKLEAALRVVKRLGGSRFILDLADNLGMVAGVLRERGKGTKGSVSVKFALENEGDQMISVDEAIGYKLPDSASRGAIFFEQDSELFERDPRQEQLVVFRDRVVDRSTGEIRTPADAGEVERKLD